MAPFTTLPVDLEKQPLTGEISQDRRLDSGASILSDKNKIDHLHIFQELVGIRTLSNIVNPNFQAPEIRDEVGRRLRHQSTLMDTPQHLQPDRPKPKVLHLLHKSFTMNDGYYKRAMDEELKARIGYTLSSMCINLIYVLQILIAATITALAAYPNHHIALTALGATNTVLAGLMAYIKGMNLPTRLLKSRDQFHQVVEYVEYKERQFARYESMPEKGKKLDAWDEADNVKNLYDAAKKDQQDNYPDLYLNNHERVVVQGILEKNRGETGLPPSNTKAPTLPLS